MSFKEDFLRALWDSWTYFADPGTHTTIEGSYLRFTSILITILGMIFFALLIGLVSEVVYNKVESLKEGKSKVYEENHILIIGFSSQIITIIKQLQLSNQNIVLLSRIPKQKVEENLLSNNIKDVVCRDGEIDNLFYLDKVNIKKAKSIIIPANSDGLNMKLILLLTKKLKLKIPITIEIEDEKYKNSLDLLERRYQNLNFIYTKQSLARLLALSSIYIGVGQTYDKLFDYNGDSFYLIDNKDFIEKTILEIANNIDKRVIGIFSQKLIIDKNYRYKKGDKLLILSKNVNFNFVNKHFNVIDISIEEIKNRDVCLVGENEKKEFIINEFQNRKIKITENSDTLVVIGKNDNEVISHLLLLKDKYRNIFAEVYSSDLVEILNYNELNDYIISNQLIAKLLVNVSSSNQLNLIVNDLLSKGGNIIYIIKIDKEISYKNLYFSLLNKDIAPIGLINEKGVILNPEDNYKIVNQKVLVISNKG